MSGRSARGSGGSGRRAIACVVCVIRIRASAYLFFFVGALSGLWPVVTEMLSKEKDYYDGPYKQMPFVGGRRALPVQVVVQVRPDGTLIFRIVGTEDG